MRRRLRKKLVYKILLKEHLKGNSLEDGVKFYKFFNWSVYFEAIGMRGMSAMEAIQAVYERRLGKVQSFEQFEKELIRNLYSSLCIPFGDTGGKVPHGR